MEVVPTPPSLSPTDSYISLPDAPQYNMNNEKIIKESKKQHKKKRGRPIIAPFFMLAFVFAIVLL